jgi:hypothetical protein
VIYLFVIYLTCEIRRPGKKTCEEQTVSKLVWYTPFPALGSPFTHETHETCRNVSLSAILYSACSVFNDALSNSDYTAPNEQMQKNRGLKRMGEKEIVALMPF